MLITLLLHPRQLALSDVPPPPGSRSSSASFWADTTVLRDAFSWLRPVRARCLLGGHDDYLAREPHRLLLRCGECGRRTPGWPIGMSPPRLTAPSRSGNPAVVARRAIREVTP